jgi:hypothetical protein
MNDNTSFLGRIAYHRIAVNQPEKAEHGKEYGATPGHPLSHEGAVTSSRHVERWTGAAGITGTLLQLVAFGVFLIGAGSPPNGEAELAAFLRSGSTALQTSFLLFFVAFVVWVAFFAGLRALIAGAGPGMDFPGSTVFGLGAAIVILGFVFVGMEAAATANAVSHPENAVIYAMYMGGSVLDGAPVAIPIVALLGVSGWVLFRSRLLSSWVVWLSWITAVLVLVSVPALYGGDQLSGIYSADGLVAEVLAFVPLYVWSLAVSIAIFRKPATG